MLADFMASSESVRRTIVRDSKFQATARVVQHEEARSIIGDFMRAGIDDVGALHAAAAGLRSRLYDTDFERDLYDHNAEYVARFAKVHAKLDLPRADIMPVGSCPPITLRGVLVTVELNFRLQRVTRTNRVRTGAAMLRYAKGKALSAEVAEWQSAFLFGYLTHFQTEAATPEHQLCLTLDAYSGVCHPAPTDAIRRFRYMEAACETIYERWPNVSPPFGAVC